MTVRCVPRSKDPASGYWGWHWTNHYDGTDGLGSAVQASPVRQGPVRISAPARPNQREGAASRTPSNQARAAKRTQPIAGGSQQGRITTVVGSPMGTLDKVSLNLSAAEDCTARTPQKAAPGAASPQIS